jgi:diguanylate cyclase (GGDEF)-like protein
VARALTDTARATDVVARLGGDEFVLLCDDLTREDAIRLAERLADAVAREPAGAPGWRVSVSIGIAMGDAEATDPSHLLSAADAAMYRAKVAGGGQPAV